MRIFGIPQGTKNREDLLCCQKDILHINERAELVQTTKKFLEQGECYLYNQTLYQEEIKIAQKRIGIKKRERKSNKCIYDTLEQGHISV